MPVKHGKDKKGCFARWGSSGKKYYYKCRDQKDRRRANKKASDQGRAAHASGYRG